MGFRPTVLGSSFGIIINFLMLILSMFVLPASFNFSVVFKVYNFPDVYTLHHSTFLYIPKPLQLQALALSSEPSWHAGTWPSWLTAQC